MIPPQKQKWIPQQCPHFEGLKEVVSKSKANPFFSNAIIAQVAIVSIILNDVSKSGEASIIALLLSSSTLESTLGKRDINRLNSYSLKYMLNIFPIGVHIEMILSQYQLAHYSQW